MSIKVCCPSCGVIGLASNATAGRVIRCNQCLETFVAGGPSFSTVQQAASVPDPPRRLTLSGCLLLFLGGLCLCIYASCMGVGGHREHAEKAPAIASREEAQGSTPGAETHREEASTSSVVPDLSTVVKETDKEKAKQEARAKRLAEFNEARERYAEQLKEYERAADEYDSARQLKLARRFADDSLAALGNGDKKEADRLQAIAERRYQEIAKVYQGSQAAQDAADLLDGNVVARREIPAAPEKPKPPTPPDEEMTDDGRQYLTGASGLVPCTISEDDLVLAQLAAKKGDTIHVQKMIDSGKVKLLDATTLIKVIDRKITRAYVEILDGPYENCCFWVAPGMIESLKPSRANVPDDEKPSEIGVRTRSGSVSFGIGEKPVSVRAYTTKDGRTVSAHSRQNPRRGGGRR